MEEVALAFESEKTCAHIREILEGTGMASCLLCHSGSADRMLYVGCGEEADAGRDRK